MFNEDLHVRLVKAYVKGSQVMQAVRHLIRIEYKEIFAYQTWYESVLNALETTANAKQMLNSNDLESHLLSSIMSILATRQLKIALQSKSSKEDTLVQTFLRLTNFLNILYTYIFNYYQ